LLSLSSSLLCIITTLSIHSHFHLLCQCISTPNAFEIVNKITGPDTVVFYHFTVTSSGDLFVFCAAVQRSSVGFTSRWYGLGGTRCSSTSNRRPISPPAFVETHALPDMDIMRGCNNGWVQFLLHRSLNQRCNWAGGVGE
jgi:hypothetical protein